MLWTLEVAAARPRPLDCLANSRHPPSDHLVGKVTPSPLRRGCDPSLQQNVNNPGAPARGCFVLRLDCGAWSETAGSNTSASRATSAPRSSTTSTRPPTRRRWRRSPNSPRACCARVRARHPRGGPQPRLPPRPVVGSRSRWIVVSTSMVSNSPRTWPSRPIATREVDPVSSSLTASGRGRWRHQLGGELSAARRPYCDRARMGGARLRKPRHR